MNKSKLQSLRKKIEGGGGKSMLFRPEEGKNKIRIIPNKYEPETNFQSLKFHYGVGQRSILCLGNFGEDCPVCNYTDELFNSGKDSDTVVAKKIMAKSRYYTPIVARTSKGISEAYWLSLSNTNLKAIIDHYDEFGDFTDPQTGNDFILTFVKKTPYNETTVTIAKSCPLLDDEAEIEKLVESVPDLMEYYLGFKKSSDEIEKAVRAWLNGDAAVIDDTEDKDVEEKDASIKDKISKMIEDDDE